MEISVDDYRSERLEEQISLQFLPDTLNPLGFVFFHSNEYHLYKLFPKLRGFENAVLGVGSDQVFDVLANTNLNSAFLVDFAKPVTLFMRTLLEVGLWYKMVAGKYPEPEQFIECFDQANMPFIKEFTINLLGENDGLKTFELIAKGLNGKGLQYSQFMRHRAQLKDDGGDTYAWYSTPSKLAKVLTLYDQGKVYIINGDLCNPEVVEKVGLKAEGMGVNFDVIYLSNAEEMMRTRNGRLVGAMWRNILTLPLSEQAVALRTAGFSMIRSLGRVPWNHQQAGNLSRIYKFDWHYNLEEIAHHVSLSRDDPEYTNRGWAKCIRKLSQDNSGFSFLTQGSTTVI